MKSLMLNALSYVLTCFKPSFCQVRGSDKNDAHTFGFVLNAFYLGSSQGQVFPVDLSLDERSVCQARAESNQLVEVTEVMIRNAKRTANKETHTEKISNGNETDEENE